MKFSAPLRMRVEKDVIVRIHRSLKGKGSINAAKNQDVTPSDIIGTAHISSGFRIINLAQILQVAPSEIEKYMKRSIGQRIYKDELLAYRSGWLLGGKKIVISPTDGILDFLNPKTGELRITFLPKKADLPAGVYGIVEFVDQDRGQVVIRTQASIVHGMFGSGRVRDGTLHIISRRDELIGKSFISPHLSEQILAGGSLVFKDAIAAAISAGVSGLITGGINAKDYKGMAGGKLIFPKKMENDIGISIVVCEGFGSIPIGWDIDEILRKYDSKFVSIDGNTGEIYLPSFEASSMTRVRNTKLPPIQNGLINFNEYSSQIVDLKVGSNVRIIGNSYTGSIGKIIALDQTETVLPSGIKTFMATVDTRHKKIQVPVANTEVIL